MSDPAPIRTIGGLAARKRPEPDLSRLRRENRPEVPAPTEDQLIEVGSVVEKIVPARPAIKSPRAKKTIKSSPAESPVVQMTTYVSTDARNRARAAYRATGHLEGDKSWSQFVETAIAAETARREKKHNNGERFKDGADRLPAGRPLDS